MCRFTLKETVNYSPSTASAAPPKASRLHPSPEKRGSKGRTWQEKTQYLVWWHKIYHSLSGLATYAERGLDVTALESSFFLLVSMPKPSETAPIHTHRYKRSGPLYSQTCDCQITAVADVLHRKVGFAK